MTAETKIEWADSTFNPWEGCQKVGPGCDHCYAETRNARFGGGQAPNWGPGAPRRRSSESNWNEPRRWQAKSAQFLAQHGRRRRVFCASLADVFDNAVPVQWRIGLMRLIAETPDLDWLLLTKRIGNAAEMLETAFRGHTAQREGWRDNVLPNVAIGATIVNQAEADRDIPKLLAVPAARRFLSMEPLLGPVDIRFAFADAGVIRCPTCGFATNDLRHGVCPNEGATLRNDPGVDWVIVGGESGRGARPMHPDWARCLRDQCHAAAVPLMFKQWGEWSPEPVEGLLCVVCRDGQVLTGEAMLDRPDDDAAEIMSWVGKKAAGRLLDGVEHNGFPEVHHA